MAVFFNKTPLNCVHVFREIIIFIRKSKNNISQIHSRTQVWNFGRANSLFDYLLSSDLPQNCCTYKRKSSGKL